MKSRKFGPNAASSQAAQVTRASVGSQDHSARVAKIRRSYRADAEARKSNRGGAKHAGEFTPQARTLRTRVGAPIGATQGKTNGIPVYAHAKATGNPSRPGIQPSGKPAMASGFRSANPRLIPVSSQQVGRPLTGRRIF